VSKKLVRKPPQKKAISETQPFSPRGLYEALLAVAPELNEAFTQAEFELALDDRGWTGYGGLTGLSQIFGGDLTPQARKIVIEKCRLSWLTDPLAKQAVRVWTTYCLGNGLTYEAEDSGIQDDLDAFFETPLNERLLNPAGQQSLSNQLLVDGDIFFAVTYADPTPLLRTFDPIQIERIITDPDDEMTVLCYRRTTAPNKNLYYADWTLGEDVSAAEAVQDPDSKQGITIERDNKGQVIPVYHLPFDRFGKHGHSLLSCSLNWSREHARFMVARVAITQALSKFATKITAKGGQAMLDAAVKRVQSSHTQTGFGTFEKNPSSAPGSTWFQNNGMDMQATPRSTGASDAKNDADSLKLMVCAGTGVMLHYMGDPSTGNLATSTAMELPMLKAFTSYQELWRGAYRRIMAIARKEDPAKKPQPITIELPPILDEDLQKLGAFLTPLTTAFPATKCPEVMRPFLIALGVENIDDVMDAIEENQKKIDAQNVKDAAAAHSNALELATVNKPAPAPAPAAPASSVKEVEAMERISRALEESNRAPSMPPITEISLSPQIIIANESKTVVKTGRIAKQANGEMTFRIEENSNGTERHTE
jgi:hypothetical protein